MHTCNEIWLDQNKSFKKSCNHKAYTDLVKETSLLLLSLRLNKISMKSIDFFFTSFDFENRVGGGCWIYLSSFQHSNINFHVNHVFVFFFFFHFHF